MKQKEFNVDDFVAEEKSFLIEVRDKTGVQLKSAQLKVTIDDGDAQTIDPGNDGLFHITPQPKDKLKISDIVGGKTDDSNASGGKTDENGFPIEVRGGDGTRLTSVQLKVTVDDGEEQTIAAGGDGLFQVKPVPKDKLRISGIVS